MKRIISIFTILLVSAVAAQNAYAEDRAPNELALTPLSIDAVPGVQSWRVDGLPSPGDGLLEASIELAVSVRQPTLISLVADGDIHAMPYANVIADRATSHVVLDATSLVRDQSLGKARAVRLVNRPLQEGNSVDFGLNDASATTLEGAWFRIVEQPARQSRVREALVQGRRPQAFLDPGTPGLPQDFGVKAYPNPFNPVTTIQIALPRAVDVELTIYNVRGQRITTLQNGNMPAGYHSLKWGGHNENGNPSASGVYFYRALLGPKTMTGKLTLLK